MVPEGYEIVRTIHTSGSSSESIARHKADDVLVRIGRVDDEEYQYADSPEEGYSPCREDLPFTPLWDECCVRYRNLFPSHCVNRFYRFFSIV